MPNYVRNKLTIKSRTKKDIIKFIERSFNNEGRFDFNKYLPPPEWGVKWNADDLSIDMLRGYTPDIKINDFTYSEISAKLRKTGCYYTFTFNFETPWSCPVTVIEEMSKVNKNVSIDVMFADEDLGYNCGTYYIKNGKYRKINVAPSSKEEKCGKKRFKWLKLACELRYDLHPSYLGYDISSKYQEEIEKDPEAYLMKLKVKDIVNKF